MVKASAALIASIDALHANVAVLDREGAIVAVNERWRAFGASRGATSDYIGYNYPATCDAAIENGERFSARAADGLRRILRGQAGSFGLVYHCGELTFRMRARPIGTPLSGVIVAHEDVTELLDAKRERRDLQRVLAAAVSDHVGQVEDACEELGQRLTAISLAALSIGRGGETANAVLLVQLAVDEARHELQRLRYAAGLASLE